MRARKEVTVAHGQSVPSNQRTHVRKVNKPLWGLKCRVGLNVVSGLKREGKGGKSVNAAMQQNKILNTLQQITEQEKWSSNMFIKLSFLTNTKPYSRRSGQTYSQQSRTSRSCSMRGGRGAQVLVRAAQTDTMYHYGLGGARVRGGD